MYDDLLKRVTELELKGARRIVANQAAGPQDHPASILTMQGRAAQLQEQHEVLSRGAVDVSRLSHKGLPRASDMGKPGVPGAHCRDLGMESAPARRVAFSFEDHAANDILPVFERRCGE
jgi:hypothetical protein